MLPAPYYADDFCTIYHGDSRELLPLLDADVMVTDPPYGYGYASNMSGEHAWKGEQIANDHDVSARDDVLAIWGGRPALAFGSWKAPRPAGTKNVIVWSKTLHNGPGMGDLSLPWGLTHEECYVLGGPWGIPDGHRRGESVVTAKAVRREQIVRLHPNEKPIPLMRELIAKCPPGTIIDPFMGSGSTLRAAKDLGRKCIGIEVDEKWCAVAVKRLAQENLFAEGIA